MLTLLKIGVFRRLFICNCAHWMIRTVIHFLQNPENKKLISVIRKIDTIFIIGQSIHLQGNRSVSQQDSGKKKDQRSLNQALVLRYLNITGTSMARLIFFSFFTQYPLLSLSFPFLSLSLLSPNLLI